MFATSANGGNAANRMEQKKIVPEVGLPAHTMPIFLRAPASFFTRAGREPIRSALTLI